MDLHLSEEPPDGEYLMRIDKIDLANRTISATALTPVQMPPRSAPTVMDCLKDLDLNKKATCRCPHCGQNSWRYVRVMGNSAITHPDDVGNMGVQCLKPQSSSLASVCKYEDQLYDFIPKNQHDMLRKDVKNWMFKQAYSSTANPLQAPTVPPPPTITLHGASYWVDKQGYVELAYEPQFEDTRCEADKPIGTRDPDKFLKEQQDKLWREW